MLLLYHFFCHYNFSERGRDMENQTSEVAILATNWLKGVAREMLDAIRANRLLFQWIVSISLASSIGHQVAFLLSRSAQHITFVKPHSAADVSVWADSISVLAMCVLIPVGIDLTVVGCIRVAQLRVLSLPTRITVGALLFALLALSGFMNYSAPGDPFMKWVSTVPVGLIAVSKLVEIIGGRPAWDLLAQLEKDAKAIIAGLMPAPVVVDAEPVSAVPVSPAPAGAGPRKRKRGTVQDLIVDKLAENPNLRPAEVAALVKCTPSYAGKVMDKLKVGELVDEVNEATASV